MFRLDAGSGMPVYQQLVEAVKQATATGRLQAGDQLPTIRELALQLRVNPNTVARAYQELEREGIVEPRRGAGSFVAAREPRLLAVSVLLFILFVVALDKGWLPWGLALVMGAYALWRPRLLLAIDWTLLAIIGLMFIDLRQLAALPALASWANQLPIGSGWRAYLAAVATSQFISNVPAAILLERYVHDLPALAAGVSVGGFGCVIGSLANLIALRLARLPNGLAEFHRISIPFLLACTASGLLVLRP